MGNSIVDNHTFVICAYKESPYLESCIRSIIGQECKSNVVLSTSTPNEYIRNIAIKYNIPLMISEGSTSLANDWNFAIKSAKTELVTLAHQDDIYAPDYSKKIIEAYKNEKSPIILFTDYGELRNRQIVKSNRLLKIKRLMLFPLRLPLLRNSRFVRRRILSLGSAICCPAVTFVKSRIQDPLFQDNMKSNIDWQAWELLSKNKGGFIYIPQILMLHRIHRESTTSELLEQKARKQEDIFMFKKFWPLPIAKTIERIYQKAEKSNSLK